MEDAAGGCTPAPKVGTKRLMIREMVLENFKSYAGEQRVGPFHKSFSSVVGPNGSGKSNVIDAMLFVFGRRAKQLRFNKVSELIHNSTSFRNLDSARVTVHFQEIVDKEGDAYDVIPGSEFSVSRTALRSNESHYYINSRRVQTKEVTDLLKAKGIDLDNNRFLILQGEVEQISMMKPKAEDKNDTGLLEYLEDIIGTDKYVQPIEEAAKSLEATNEKRQGLIARLKISEKERESLQGKATEAQQFLDKQAEMVRCRIQANHVFTAKIRHNLSVMDSQRRDLLGKLEHEKAKSISHEQELNVAEKRFALADGKHAAVVKVIEEADDAFKDVNRRDAQNGEDIKHLKAKIKKATDKLAADTESMGKLEAEMASLQAEAPRLAAQAEALAAELAKQEAELERMLDSIKGEVEAYHQQLSQVRSELAPWEKQMSEVQGRIKVAQGEVDLLQRQQRDAAKRLQDAVGGLEQAKVTAAEKQASIRELEGALEACKAKVEAHRGELVAAQMAERHAEDAIGSVRDRLAALKSEVSSSQHQGAVVRELMAAKSRGELSGVYGRLGDLAAIDAKYDAAVSTAVGALEYIVVETASDAQRCVEHLRRCGAGVATFLILERQRHLTQAANERTDTPEGCPRLYDLIKISNPGLKIAFYFAMGNTLVAKDLDQASRIAYGSDRRFRRVVTLQGNLIADTGTMSGGGRPSTGRMTLGNAAPRNADAKAAEGELKEVEKQHAKLSQELQAARERIAVAQQAVRAAEKELSSLEVALPKARLEAEANAQRAVDLQQRMQQLQQNAQVSEADAGRLEELRATVQQEEAQLAKLKQQCSGLEKRATELQCKITNAGGDAVKAQRDKVSKGRKKVEALEADASKKEAMAKAHAKSVEKLKKDITKQGKEREKLQADEAACKEHMRTLEDEALAVLAKKEDAEKQAQETGAELEAVRQQRDQLKRNLGVVQQTAANIEEEVDKMAKVSKEESSKADQFAKDTDNQRKKLADIIGSGDYVVDEEALVGSTPPGKLNDKGNEFVYRATILEAELEKLSPDMDSIKEFQAKDAEHSARLKEMEEATAERDTVRKQYDGLRKTRLDEFMAGFNTISMKLKEMYQMITLGGDAELELVDSLDPFSEGIVFSVRPPKKSWKHISNLSGGEKTLSSLALVFALHHYKPNPLYVMDEIDAALDFKNVSIVGHYIKERTRDAQFIIISLRNNMFELADRLVGIYKTDNTTKTVAINPSQFAVPAAPSGQAQAGNGGNAQTPIAAA